MKNHKQPLDFKLIDFIPAIAGLIGKIALVSSFAVVWSQSLNITSPNFVFENVRIEIIIGSIITLLVALLLPRISPAGTLAPLIVLVPTMAAFGVHPLILSMLIGILGIVSIKTKIFHILLKLSGAISKTSLALTVGISGVIMSVTRLNHFFVVNYERYTPMLVLLIILSIVYCFLLKYKKNWLVIPVAAVFSVLIPILFGIGIDLSADFTLPKFSPNYWWNDMWGIGYGFNLVTILKTLPFALFAILLWTVDTLAINAMLDSNYKEGEQKEDININVSFIVTSIRNMIGGAFGGAQTAALWRSYLIPLFMIKRPIRPSSIILGVFGIVAGFTALPIKVLSFPPLIWSVLLFGIFLPFVIVSIVNLIKTNKYTEKGAIVLFAALGVLYSPIFTWIGATVFEKAKEKISK